MTRTPSTHRLAGAARRGGLRALLLLITAALLVQAASAQTTETPAPASAEQPDLAQAQALIAAGQPEAAFNLLAPFEDTWAGHLQYDYLLARAALESGRPSLASFIYERILAVEPNYVGVRLENGRAYLDLGNYARAKQEFETVLRVDNLPPDLRATAEQYARIAEQGLEGKRTFFTGYAEYGFGYDSNINAALAESVVPLPGGLFLLLPDLSVEQDDWYNALNAGGEVIHALTDRFSVFAAADYRGRFYLYETFFNYSDIEGRVGVGIADGPHNVRVSGRYGTYILDNSTLRDVYGGTVDWLYALGTTDQLNLTATYSAYRFKDDLLESNDFDGYGLALAWNHALLGGKALVGTSINLGYEDAINNRIDGDNTIYGLTLTGQASVTDSVGVFAVGGVQRGDYDQLNPLFQRTRTDTYWTATGGVTWTFHRNFSLRPQVSWSQNDSNIPLNEFDRYDVSLNLRASF
ncbi:MAG: tetratricopeptide repeat protein [Gammaproteobacteria bacterium]|nr:tetratricopeptide repeat protein [Gammaproteobacteria bacterium]